MKKQKVLTLILGTLVGALIVILLGSCSKEEFNPSLTRNFTLQAASNGALYEIKVALPEDYNSLVEKNATLYVLDGEENFDFVARHCKEISDQYGVANVVVVSIGYGQDRSIDYTPTQVSSTTGGGAQFLDFIEHQVIPRIEQDFMWTPHEVAVLFWAIRMADYLEPVFLVLIILCLVITSC
ncbi:MAG: hypothetical protein IPK96_12105 [Flammeovirgaceae bacterium]|nr:hypothetical protein [Flammeovirgaceae bacterium]